MDSDQFSQRLAAVRQRFAAKLTTRIHDTETGLPKLAGDGPAVIDDLVETYHRIHELCGMGATVGFAATSRAARTMEQMLLEPYRARRPLTPSEIERLRPALDALRAAAKVDCETNGIPAE